MATRGQPSPPPPKGSWESARRQLREVSVLIAALGAAAVVGGGIIFIALDELSSYGLDTVAVGAGLLLLSFAISFRDVRRSLVGRRGRYTANALIIVAAFTTIAVLVSLISYLNSGRYDSTATKQFTLAPQTKKILNELKEPVRATAFFVLDSVTQQADRQRTDDFFFEFERRAGGDFSYRFIDPEAEPAIPRQFEITEFPSILFEAQESNRRHVINVPPVEEQDLTSALITVTDPEAQKSVYFLTGHSERDVNDVAENSPGFGNAARGILGDNYQVKTVNLFKDKAMPSDVAVLVIAGPQSDLLTDEIPLLVEYLGKGGRALFLAEPNTPPQFRRLLALWGVRVLDGIVVDPDRSVAGDPRTILMQRADYAAFDITKPLDATFYPAVAGLDLPEEFKQDPRKQPPWIEYLPLIPTSANSWVTTEPDRSTFDEKKDIKGPVNVGLVVSAASNILEEPVVGEGAPTTLTRLVVIGDADFASNRYYSAYSNGDLLVNSVNWLAQDYDLISIRPKPVVFRQLVLTNSQFDFIRYASWFFLPGVIALGGIFAWWRRR
ncbi:MAG: hypothetical protein EXR48_02530 [Dehalococcoidia bacterium]|nr:hypothetical protein [Dehalococcoidia bacterium]